MGVGDDTPPPLCLYVGVRDNSSFTPRLSVSVGNKDLDSASPASVLLDSSPPAVPLVTSSPTTAPLVSSAAVPLVLSTADLLAPFPAADLLVPSAT